MLKTLEVGNATALGTLESITSMTSGATLELNGFSPTLTNLTGAGGSTVENESASTAATLNTNVASGTVTYGGNVVNGGAATLAVNKSGAGTLALGGTNTYTGGTTLTTGNLNFTGNNNFGSGGITVTAGNLTFLRDPMPSRERPLRH